MLSSKKKIAKLRLEFSSLKRFLLEKESGESESSFSFVSEPPLAGPRAELSAAAAVICSHSHLGVGMSPAVVRDPAPLLPSLGSVVWKLAVRLAGSWLVQ